VFLVLLPEEIALLPLEDNTHLALFLMAFAVLENALRVSPSKLVLLAMTQTNVLLRSFAIKTPILALVLILTLLAIPTPIVLTMEPTLEFAVVHLPKENHSNAQRPKTQWLQAHLASRVLFLLWLIASKRTTANSALFLAHVLEPNALLHLAATTIVLFLYSLPTVQLPQQHALLALALEAVHLLPILQFLLEYVYGLLLS